VDQRPTAPHTEPFKTADIIQFLDAPIKKRRGAARLKRRPQTAPAVIEGWLLLMNLLAFILMSEMVRYILTK
jgi:hypothetical protein